MTLGSRALIRSTVVDDVGPGLLVNREHDRRLVVVIGRGKAISRGRDRAADIADPDRRAVAVGEDDFFERFGIGDLVIGLDGEARLGASSESPSARRSGSHQCAADFFERQSARGELGGIDLDPDRRSLLAADSDLGDARHLRDLLGEIVVSVLVDGGNRHCVGVRRKDQDRRIGRIELLVGRRRRHGLRQRLARRRDRGLHVLGARSILRLRSNCTVIDVAPSALNEVIWVTPAIWPSWRSSGVATEDAMVSALAPASVAVTCTVGKSTCGSGATGRSRNAAMPTSATAPISSEVATGRRIKGSEMFTWRMPSRWRVACPPPP